MINFDKDEHFIFEVRKHWLLFVVEIILIIIFSILPFVLLFFLLGLDFGSQLNFLNFIWFFTFFYSGWILMLWLVGNILWVSYYLDVWIITNKRIIDIEQHALFKREISILNLNRIQDVTYKIDGVIPTMLNYGDIIVRTAGSDDSFVIKGISNPPLVQEKISQAIRESALDNLDF